MNRHQTLERLLAADTPSEVAAIEASLRAIASRLDAVDTDAEYDDVHRRLDELLTARDAALTHGALV
ncbi:MAG: hypothetical protein WAV00_03295 [Nocardioides sp.]|jgi:hypothetical protein